MAQPNGTKELIKFNTEMMKLLGIVLIATLGGAITLIVGGPMNGPKAVFVFFGLLLSTAIIYLLYQLYKSTNTLINELL
jgi:hypothetical protein